MADIINDGMTKVWWVPTIANIAAPTTAELNAGMQLEHRVTADGLVGYEAETAEVPTDALNSTFDTKLPGRASFSGTMLRIKKSTGVDTIYDTLVRNAAGNVVVRRDTASATAWTVGDKVEVYPTTCGQTKLLAPEANTVRRFEVPTMISPEPNLRAVVA